MSSADFQSAAGHTFFRLRGGRWFAVLGIFFLLVRAAAGQEALRASLAGQYAVEAQKNATANQYYNLKIGDLKLRFQGALGVEATDNVNYTETKTQADISFRPQLDITAMLPVTDRNTLATTIGVGYAKYMKTKLRDHFFLTPNSRLSFNVYAGDFVFDIHTQFTYTQDSYQSEIYGGNYGYFENLSGVTVTWDLNKVIFTLSLEHEIYSPTDKRYEYQGRSSELCTARAVYLLNPTTQLGLQLGFSTAEFDVKPKSGYYVTIVSNAPVLAYGVTNLSLSDQMSFNLGPYFRSDLSRHVRVTAATGYAIYMQDQDSAFGKAGNNGAFFADIQLQHTVNSQLGYSLNLGHQVRQGLTSDTLNYYYFRLSPRWRVFQNLVLSFPINVESTTIANRNEEYIYGTFGLEATWQFSRNLNLSCGYNRRTRDSNLPGGSYTQNQLVLTSRYSF